MNRRTRNAALSKNGSLFMNRIWTYSKWTKTQLDGKLVEFRLRSNQDLLQGFGQFLVYQNRDGLLSIDVVYDVQKSRDEKISRHLPLSQADVDEIQLHDVPALAQFRLMYCRIVSMAMLVLRPVRRYSRSFRVAAPSIQSSIFRSSLLGCGMVNVSYFSRLLPHGGPHRTAGCIGICRCRWECH